MKTVFCLIVFAASFTVAQVPASQATTNQPPATRIGPHRLGETIEEWLSVERPAFQGAKTTCGLRVQVLRDRWSRADPSGSIMAPYITRVHEECVEETGKGIIVTGDYSDKKYGWKFVDAKL